MRAVCVSQQSLTSSAHPLATLHPPRRLPLPRQKRGKGVRTSASGGMSVTTTCPVATVATTAAILSVPRRGADEARRERRHQREMSLRLRHVCGASCPIHSKPRFTVAGKLAAKSSGSEGCCTNVNYEHEEYVKLWTGKLSPGAYMTSTEAVARAQAEEREGSTPTHLPSNFSHGTDGYYDAEDEDEDGQHHHHDHHHGHGHHGHSHAELFPRPKWVPNALRQNAELFCTMTRLRRCAEWLRGNESPVVAFAGACMFAIAVLTMSAEAAASAAAFGVTANVLGWLALAVLGVPALEEMIIALSSFRTDIHMLMSLGAFASAALGTPCEGALLLLMFKSAHVIERELVAKTDTNVGKAAMDLCPPTALRFDTPPTVAEMQKSETSVVSVDTLSVGDAILVRRGDVAPVDGIVAVGRCHVIAQHLTGESVPVRAAEGDAVAAGSIASDGEIVLRVTRTPADSTLARISKLANEGSAKKPPIQRWLDEVMSVYSRWILFSTVAIFTVLALMPRIGLEAAARRALGFLVAASPCALAAAPLSYAAAISSCARKGLIIRGGKVLDALARCDMVAFDKTGTLTTGDLALSHAECDSVDEEWNVDVAITVASKMEHGVIHPIARALEREHRNRTHASSSPPPPPASIEVSNINVIPGEGVSAKVRLPGMAEPCEAFLGRHRIALGAATGDDRGADGSSTGNLGGVVLRVGSRACRFSFRDRIRESSESAVAALRDEFGVEAVMLTGDSGEAARAVALKTGISAENTYASLSPSGKMDVISRMQSREGKRVLMVGEGVNDAPALAASSVGLTLSQRASAASVAAADVLMVREDLQAVVFAIKMSKLAINVVRASVGIAATGITLASLASVMGSLPLWLVVLVHEGGTRA